MSQKACLYSGLKDTAIFPLLGNKLSQQWDLIFPLFSHMGIPPKKENTKSLKNRVFP